VVPAREPQGFRRLAAGVVLALAAVVAACGTDAVGVETCRTIEFARCDAARACGLVDDVEACRRFARDHCLHGLAADKPSPSQVNRCVATIEALGKCADENGKRSTPSECKGAGSVSEDANDVCELVLEPELTQRCEFLVPPEPEPEPEPSGDAGKD